MIAPTLRSAMDGSGKPMWVAILSELYPIMAGPKTTEVEQLLNDIIGFNGQLSLDQETFNGPQSQAPENMLKSLAIQTLEKMNEQAGRQ